MKLWILCAMGQRPGYKVAKKIMKYADIKTETNTMKIQYPTCFETHSCCWKSRSRKSYLGFIATPLELEQSFEDFEPLQR